MNQQPAAYMPRIDPRAPGFYVQVYACVDAHTVHHLVNSLERQLGELPRWRWVRRFHLERQLFVAQLAYECYRSGVLGRR